MNHKVVSLIFVLFFFLVCEPGHAEDNASNAVADHSAASAAIGGPELQVKYWGNNNSQKFHRPSCPFAKSMNSRHVVLFHFRHEAIEAGQQPCRYCLPPFVKRVECVLLPKTSKTAKAEDATVTSAIALPQDEGAPRSGISKLLEGEKRPIGSDGEQRVNMSGSDGTSDSSSRQ